MAKKLEQEKSFEKYRDLKNASEASEDEADSVVNGVEENNEKFMKSLQLRNTESIFNTYD